jgi:hypothetical protein
MEGLVRTLDFLFGCHHSNLSRVFTLDGRTYRVCCSCGAKFDYSLENMCSGHRVRRRLRFGWLRIA